MHIYSSPSNIVSKTWVLYPQSMSITCFLTVYILSKSGFVRTAFVSFYLDFFFVSIQSKKNFRNSLETRSSPLPLP